MGGGGGRPARLSAGGHAAHEHAIILRIDHRCAIAQQRAFADYAGVVPQNRDSALWIVIQKPQHELVDQRRLSRAARPGENNYFRCSMFDVRCLMSFGCVARWLLSLGLSYCNLS